MRLIGTGRDLMSLLMKSNMSATTPSERRLTLDNILDQISTFVTVGTLRLLSEQQSNDLTRSQVTKLLPLPWHGAC